MVLVLIPFWDLLLSDMEVLKGNFQNKVLLTRQREQCIVPPNKPVTCGLKTCGLMQFHPKCA